MSVCSRFFLALAALPLALTATPLAAGVGESRRSRRRGSFSMAAAGPNPILNNIGEDVATYRVSVELRADEARRLARGGDRSPMRAKPTRPRDDPRCPAQGHLAPQPAAVDPHQRPRAARSRRRRISRPSAVPRHSRRAPGDRSRADQGRVVPPDPGLRRHHPGHRPPLWPPGHGGDRQCRQGG